MTLTELNKLCCLIHRERPFHELQDNINALHQLGRVVDSLAYDLKSQAKLEIKLAEQNAIASMRAGWHFNLSNQKNNSNFVN